MGRNLVKFLKELMASYLICNHFDVAATFFCFFVFRWMELKFGVKGNSGFLISNLISKVQYYFKIVRKMALFFSSIMIFSPAPPHELVTCLQYLNFKTYYR